MKKVKIAHRFAVLFASIGLLLILLIGHYMWQVWQDYRSARDLQQHFQLSTHLVEVVNALQQERLLSVRYVHTHSETAVSNLSAELLAHQHISQDLIAQLFQQVRYPFLSKSRQQEIQQAVIRLELLRAQLQHGEALEGKEDRVFAELGTAISVFMSALAHEEVLYSVDAYRFVLPLYHLIELKESVGQIRALGVKILLTNQLTLSDQLALARGLERAELFLKHDVNKASLEEQSCWQSMDRVVNTLIYQDAFDVQEVFSSLADWSDIMNQNHTYLFRAVHTQIDQVNDHLARMVKGQIWQLVLAGLFALLLLLVLIYVYVRWVLQGFVRAFSQLREQLMLMTQQIDQQVFQPVCVPEECVSEEIYAVTQSANELLTDIEFAHYILTQHTEELEQMVQAVITVMTQVNQGNWEVVIDLPAEGQLALLKDTINKSIAHIRQIQLVNLHQERLTIMGNMAASMAHEINNPIAGVMMNLAYLSEMSLDDEMAEIVDESQQNILRVSKLIKSMLTFSRKPVNTSAQVCSLRQVMDDVFVMAKNLAHTAGVVFHYDPSSMADVSCEVKAEADKVEQILLNLITNAVQAMKPIAESGSSANLTLDCYFLEEAKQALIRVSDTGPGIPHGIQDRIFDPFFTTKAQSEGTGLGLSISMQIVKAFGGMLVLDEYYQQGARFLLYLPLTENNQQENKAIISETMRHTLSDNFGADTYQEILDHYIALLPQALSNLRAAFDEHDMKQAKYLAHDLKGSSQGLGVVLVANICAELEVLIAGWSAHPQPEIAQKVFARLERIAQALQAQAEKEQSIEIHTPPSMRR